MEKYKDIIYLTYPKSNARKHMSMHDRAAQFSAFAALSGYEEAIEEEARLTDRKVRLSDDEKGEIGEKLKALYDRQGEHPMVLVTYFVPDSLKTGGRYVQAAAPVKKIRDLDGKLILQTGKEIAFDDILSIDADI